MLPQEVLDHVDHGKSRETGTSSNAAVGCRHPCWGAAFSDELFEVTHAPAREPAKRPSNLAFSSLTKLCQLGMEHTHAPLPSPCWNAGCLVPVQATVAPVGAQVQ